jgi:manganese transport protein
MPPPTDTAALQIAPPVGAVLPGEQRVLEAAERSLQGQRRGMRAMWPFLGPAFIAAVAYVDPGNFATNLAGGAKFGYMLLWVILVSNLMAMLIQTMSAKLGIATGMNLPEVCRAQFPTPVTITLWIQAEVIAMATDLAEFIGAALGLNLLFGTPLVWAGLLTGVFAFAILALQTKGGFRHLEAIIIGLVGLIVAGFAFEVVNAGASAHGVATGLVIPRFSGSESVLLAAGILGATVMPHVIYLHSALTQHRIVPRNDEEAKTLYRYTRIDVLIAMVIAGLINMSMLVIAATVFFGSGLTNVSSLEGAHRTLEPLLGGASSVLFALALTASGLSSSTVGTMSGQVVMQGFIQRQIPLFVRRFVTMIPAFIVIALQGNNGDVSRTLVISQVVLSFGIPFALIPLVMFTSRRDVMGVLVNARATVVAAVVVATIITGLNIFLLAQTFGLMG